jgi:hypothetical protein
LGFRFVVFLCNVKNHANETKIFILLLIPVRTWLLPRYFTDQELRLLDAPTASPFTMVSVGGNYGEVLDDVFEQSSSPEDKSEGGVSPPTEEDSEAERGEAEGRARRRSFRRVSHGEDGIELAGFESR